MNFQENLTVETAEMLHSQFYLDMLKKLPGIEKALKVFNGTESPEVTAAGIEFILEGLYASKRLSKSRLNSKLVYGR